MNPSLRRVVAAFTSVWAAIGLGGFALWLLGGGQWSFGETVYNAIISVSTVGFGELPGIERVPWARVATATTIICGLGAVAFFQSALTALIVEGVVGQALRRRRMRKTIQGLRNHVVVAGIGSTGRHVIEELVVTGTPFVVVDRSHEHLLKVSDELYEGRMLYVHGDATEDQTLMAAGIERASGVICALTNDKENLFVTLTARTLNPRARIVAKVVEAEVIPKMVRAGANATVSPNIIGGRRMASELIRPEVVEFVDQMLRDKDRNLRLEEVTVPPSSSFAGQALRDVPIRRETNALVVAVRDRDRQFQYNPGPDHVLEAGTVLVVLGETSEVQRLRGLVARSTGGRGPESKSGA